MTDLSNRRPLKSRGSAWARSMAKALAKGRGVSPDMISFLSVCFALVGGASLALSGLTWGLGRGAVLVLAALCIQLRLLCNLLDGMVAVEHGKGGPLGPLWNELPDRFADVLLLVGAGYAATDADATLGPALGWACAALALICAYVRELGRSLGRPADFSGPMAKPHRMALLTSMALLSTLEVGARWHGEVMLGGLGLMAALIFLTIVRRVRRLANALKLAPLPDGVEIPAHVHEHRNP